MKKFDFLHFQNKSDLRVKILEVFILIQNFKHVVLETAFSNSLARFTKITKSILMKFLTSHRSAIDKDSGEVYMFRRTHSNVEAFFTKFSCFNKTAFQYIDCHYFSLSSSKFVRGFQIFIKCMSLYTVIGMIFIFYIYIYNFF